MKKLKIDLEIRLNMNKPDGTPRKILDTSLAQSYGWKSKIDMDHGFNLTYRDYLKKHFI